MGMTDIARHYRVELALKSKKTGQPTRTIVREEWAYDVLEAAKQASMNMTQELQPYEEFGALLSIRPSDAVMARAQEMAGKLAQQIEKALKLEPSK